MPRSSRRHAAKIRRLYTGERFPEALAGIARDGSHGLDACSPAQAELRYLMALGFLNTEDSERPLGWNIAALSGYSMTVSPRYDRLVLISHTPGGVARRLVPDRQGAGGLPGLRIEESRAVSFYENSRMGTSIAETHMLRHLPTGGQIVVTNHYAGTVAGEQESYIASRRMAPTSVPVQPEESALLRQTPRVSADARALLSGVVCRISTSDPAGNWALGQWYYDPLSREKRRFYRDSRTLTGAGDHWKLRWHGYPYLADVVATTTDPHIGLSGATAVGGEKETTISSGTASLKLVWERP